MILTLNCDSRIFDSTLLMIYQELATQIPWISSNVVIAEQYLKLTSGFVRHLIKNPNSSDLGDSNIHSSSMLLETNLSNIKSQLILLLT